MDEEESMASCSNPPMDLSSLEAAMEVLDHSAEKKVNHERLDEIHA
jgi:hypothetical protein